MYCGVIYFHRKLIRYLSYQQPPCALPQLLQLLFVDKLASWQQTGSLTSLYSDKNTLYCPEKEKPILKITFYYWSVCPSVCNSPYRLFLLSLMVGVITLYFHLSVTRLLSNYHELFCIRNEMFNTNFSIISSFTLNALLKILRTECNRVFII